MGDCFSSFEPDRKIPTAAAKTDIKALHGYWLNKGTPCSTPSFDSWTIDASGASGYESSCALRSATRKGKVFTLKQRCEYFENEVKDETIRVRIISRKEIDISGTRYKKCPRP